MSQYIFVDKTNKITALINYGKSVLPQNYPVPENNIVLEIPTAFANIIKQKWGQVDIFVKDINTVMDSAKDYTEYFTDVTKEQTQASNPVEELQKQVADLQNQIKEMKANG